MYNNLINPITTANAYVIKMKGTSADEFITILVWIFIIGWLIYVVGYLTKKESVMDTGKKIFMIPVRGVAVMIVVGILSEIF